jgi:hypothetical protein
VSVRLDWAKFQVALHPVQSGVLDDPDWARSQVAVHRERLGVPDALGSARFPAAVRQAQWDALVHPPIRVV